MEGVSFQELQDSPRGQLATCLSTDLGRSNQLLADLSLKRREQLPPGGQR
ncbi:hypothetical protein R50072_15670 [Simiduia litorea]